MLAFLYLHVLSMQTEWSVKDLLTLVWPDPPRPPQVAQTSGNTGRVARMPKAAAAAQSESAPWPFPPRLPCLVSALSFQNKG